jgi:hypothetical protein
VTHTIEQSSHRSTVCGGSVNIGCERSLPQSGQVRISMALAAPLVTVLNRST